MNWHPLIKVSGILVLTWILFFIAQKSFEKPSVDHLDFIPANADAVLILNNKKIGGALFYERFFHEDTYRSKVDIDEELERELLADAVKAGVDLLSPIACFSYSAEGVPVLGITAKASDKEDLEDFLKKYLPKTNYDLNFEVYVNEKGAVVLFTEKDALVDLKTEVENLKEKYGSATKEDWFKPLMKGSNDVAIFFNPHMNSGSFIVKGLYAVTPSIVESSYTFLTLKEDKLSIVHEANTSLPVQDVLSDNRKSIGMDDAFLSAEFHWKPYESVGTDMFELSTDSGMVDLHLDSLLAGDVSLRMDGFGLTGLSLPSADALAAVRINSEYWQRKKTELLYKGGLSRKGSLYQLILKLPVQVIVKEKDDFLLISQREKLLSTALESSQNDFKFHLDLEGLLNNIDLIPIRDNWDIKTVTMESTNSEGKQLKFEGEVRFKHANHGIIDVMHMMTTMDDELEGLQISTFKEILGAQ